jgi:hypothetical protein
MYTIDELTKLRDGAQQAAAEARAAMDSSTPGFAAYNKASEDWAFFETIRKQTSMRIYSLKLRAYYAARENAE